MDYSSEPMTLVEFTLADAPGGTTLTVTESIRPDSGRAPPEAFRMVTAGRKSCSTSAVTQS